MKKQRKLNGGAKMGFLFALPAAIYMMVFIGYPMIKNLILSFKNVDVYSFAQPQNQMFVGLQNYIELFTSGNSILSKSIVNTLVFTVGSIFFQFIIGFALALLFNKKFPGCSAALYTSFASRYTLSINQWNGCYIRHLRWLRSLLRISGSVFRLT